MKKLLITFLLVVSSTVYAEGEGTIDVYNIDDTTFVVTGSGGGCMALDNRTLKDSFPVGKTTVTALEVQVARGCTKEERAIAALPELRPTWVIHDNGSQDRKRPGKILVDPVTLTLKNHRTERGVIGDGCNCETGYIKNVKDKHLKYCRLRTSPYIYVCQELR